jgi:hypothetical protein
MPATCNSTTASSARADLETAGMMSTRSYWRVTVRRCVRSAIALIWTNIGQSLVQRFVYRFQLAALYDADRRERATVLHFWSCADGEIKT